MGQIGHYFWIVHMGQWVTASDPLTHDDEIYVTAQ